MFTMKSMCDCKGKCANPHTGMFILRLVVGVIFIYNGWYKLHNLVAAQGYFVSLHLWPWLATFVSVVELVGGAALVLGIWTCFFASILSIIMLVALIWTKFGDWNFGAIQFPLLNLAALIAIKHVGRGRWGMGRGCGCMVCKKGEEVVQ